MIQIGFVNRASEIEIHEWPSLNMVSQIDACGEIPSYNLKPSEIWHLQLKSFAFDKSKLVVAILSDKSEFYAVFDIHTEELMQTFYNPSDGHDPASNGSFGTIHLAPNGKIITDFEYVLQNIQILNFEYGSGSDIFLAEI